MKRIALIQTVRSGELRPDIGLSTLYLSAYVNKYEPGKFVFDNFYADKNFDVAKIVSQYDLIGVSSVTCTYKLALSIARQSKIISPNVPVILGGAHINSMPETLSDGFDCAVLGEGEETFRELCNILYQQGGLSYKDIKNVDGVMYKDNGSLIRTSSRKPIADINKIPFPDRSVFFKHSSIPSIITSRGCPHKCLFCANAVYGRQVRSYSAENIYLELKAIKRATPECKVIVFKDDIFTLNKKLLRELALLVSGDANLSSIKLVCQGHVKFIDDEVVRLLKQMNFKKILFGFESMSERILRRVKPGLTTQDNMRAIEICARYGLWCGGNFMIGFPEETKEDIITTYDFMIENLKNGKLFMVTTTILMPFPGTYYWDIACQKGLIDNADFDWNRTEDIGFIAAWENSGRTITMEQYWQLRKEKRLLYIGSQSTQTMGELMSRYETEVFKLQENNIVKDRANE